MKKSKAISAETFFLPITINDVEEQEEAAVAVILSGSSRINISWGSPREM